MNLFKRVWNYFEARDHIDADLCVYRAPESLEMELTKSNNLAKLKSALVAGEIDPNGSFLWNAKGHPLLGYAVGMNKRDVVRLLLLYKGSHRFPSRSEPP